MIKESAKWREQDRVKNQGGNGNGGRSGPGFYENVENFTPNGPSGGYAPPPPPSSDSNIEVVETEVVDNDDN
jgi:hypothetical protein